MKPIYALVPLLLLLLCCFGWKACKHSHREPTITSTHSDTITKIIHDTAWYQAKTNPRITDSVFVPMPANIDTALVLKRYFARYAYTDSLKDTNVSIVINDTISQNKIMYRQYHYQLQRPQVIQHITNTTTIVQPNKAAFYIGAQCAIGGRGSIGPTLLLTSGNAAYQVGYDLYGKNMTAQIGWKIHFKRKY